MSKCEFFCQFSIFVSDTTPKKNRLSFFLENFFIERKFRGNSNEKNLRVQKDLNLQICNIFQIKKYQKKSKNSA